MDVPTPVLVEDFLRSILEAGKLEQMFAPIMIRSAATDLYNRTYREKKLTSLLVNLQRRDDRMKTNGETTLAVKLVIDRLSIVGNNIQSSMLVQLIEYGIRQGTLPTKIVLESILMNQNFTFEKSVFWQQGLGLVERTIHLVDYKGVRDILKLLIDRVMALPSNLPSSMIGNAESLFRVFKLILSRKTCLLPAYLVLDELQKKIPAQTLHWKFSALITAFIESFKPVTQLVTISNRSKLVPIVGFSTMLSSAGSKLEPSTAKFSLKGLLPYDDELVQPQSELLCHILSQPYSRDLVCSMLGLTVKHKQRCPFLEDQLVELIIRAMERTEGFMFESSESKMEVDTGETPSNAAPSPIGSSLDPATSPVIYSWQHLSTHLIYFVLFHHASFPHMIRNLCSKLDGRNLTHGREHLMWILLQFISGSIQKNPLSDFLPILDLFNLLYTEKTSLPLPDISRASSTHTLAAASIWIHLSKKADMEPAKIGRRVPVALEAHVQYLQTGFPAEVLFSSLGTDYRVAILCNAYSTNQEQFSRPMAVLVEAALGSSRSSSSKNSSSVESQPANSPIPITILDSLTVHTKMSLIHSIPGHITKTCQNASNMNKTSCSAASTALSPSFLETYSRLLIYSEIESLGVKGFMNQILNNPPVWRSAPNIYHSILETFTYRLHHVPSHYRIQLLIHLNSPQGNLFNHVQLHLCMEHTATKILLGLSSLDCLSLPQFTRLPVSGSSGGSDASKGYKQLISIDSEELNKILIFSIARAVTLSHSDALAAVWVKDILTEIASTTPISWSANSLACFPQSIADFYATHPIPLKDKSNLKRLVDEEFRKWKMMNNENDIISHFSHATSPSHSPLFLCLIWKMLLEQETSPIRLTAYKILDRIGSRALSAHLRTFADYLIVEFANSGGNHVPKYIEALNAMMWKCHIVPLDRLVLTLALRPYDGDEATVCHFIIQMILLKQSDFKNRVNEFCKENSADHWRQSDWHEKHTNFLNKYPEKYYFENLGESSAIMHKYIPVYFHNVCLRFLPVLDIVIHRFLEHWNEKMTPESIIDAVGQLYKFHDRPLTYLYGTLFYYCKKLSNQVAIKQKLVSVIMGSQRDPLRGEAFTIMLSEQFARHMAAAKSPTNVSDESRSSHIEWTPDLDYYRKLMGRLKDTMLGRPVANSETAKQGQLLHLDWRFSEFVNVSSMGLHVTCIELMALGTSPTRVANSLIDVIMAPNKEIRSELDEWVNAVGTTLTALPEPYWTCIFDRILQVMQYNLSEMFCDKDLSPSRLDVFQLMEIAPLRVSPHETLAGLLVSLVHATLYSATVGQICLLPAFLKERVKPLIRTEEQFLFIAQLVCPFFQRLCSERTRTVMDATIELYEMLEIVDRNSSAAERELRYLDPISDLLYHIKYQYTGDSVKAEVEKWILAMRPQLQAKLRFITHLNPEEVAMNRT